MTTLFISDLHLEDQRADITACLLNFLEQEAAQADALYILGDLFEYWIGDDVQTETSRRVADALSRLQQVPCFFIHGNRDFLLGEEYARQAGITLLPETTVIDLYGTPTLLLHGDSLCTDDVEYQAFRQQVRNPEWQQYFLNMSLTERLEMAAQARDASKQHTGSQSMEIMDVNPQAVTRSFADHGVNHMIHGHTHRPAIHEHNMRQRIVLGDWYTQGSVLRVSENGTELAKLTF